MVWGWWGARLSYVMEFFPSAAFWNVMKSCHALQITYFCTHLDFFFFNWTLPGSFPHYLKLPTQFAFRGGCVLFMCVVIETIDARERVPMCGTRTWQDRAEQCSLLFALVIADILLNPGVWVIGVLWATGKRPSLLCLPALFWGEIHLLSEGKSRLKELLSDSM